MKVTSSAFVDGKINLKFGKHSENVLKGMPTFSLPLEISDAPVGTVSYAIILDDKDAIPVCGFTWIHWSVANLTRKSLAENESQTATDFVQGVNSWASGLLGSGALSREEASQYGGMAPPDATHSYDLQVFALDTKFNLKPGFFANELYHAMKGHILATATLSGSYPHQI